MDLEPLKMKASHFCKMPEALYSVIVHHIQGDWNAQVHYCENIKTFIEIA
jgi:hypothetical protein